MAPETGRSNTARPGNVPGKGSVRPAQEERYIWLINGMDCPNCARKIEAVVGKLASVSQARVLFAMEQLVVDAAEDVRQQVELTVNNADFALTHNRLSGLATMIRLSLATHANIGKISLLRWD